MTENAKRKVKAKPMRAPTPKPRVKPKKKSRSKAPSSKKPVPPPKEHPEPTEKGEPGDITKMYGGFQLQLHDHDLRAKGPAVYGGKLRPSLFSTPIKANVAPGQDTCNVFDKTRLVAGLRADLWHLGFWVFPREKKTCGAIGPVDSDTFDWRTEWAVREFQIAATMPSIAVEDMNKEPTADEILKKGLYLSRLSAKPNDKKLAEHPSGVVTAKTAETIKYWIEHHYRCPVIIQAMATSYIPSPIKEGKKQKPTTVLVVHKENLWRHDEVTNRNFEMYACDFSGYYEFGEIPKTQSSQQIYVGKYSPHSSGRFGGPRSQTPWPITKLTPESWRGNPWDKMGPEEKSTWRVITAVAAVECGGGLDLVNFWDNCQGSAGHFHWTMPKHNGSSGEFCGFMASLEKHYPDAFKKCFANFGLWGPSLSAGSGRDTCTDGPTSGGYLYTKDVNGKFQSHPRGADPKERAQNFDESHWLRGWHAAYRLEMAARTCPDYRKAMWDRAYRRITVLRGLSKVDAWLPEECKIPGRRATVGDILSSERGMAFALRLHVWRPASFVHDKRDLTPTKKGLPILHDALEAMMKEETIKDESGEPKKDGKGNVIKWKMPVNNWTDDHERLLINKMIELVGIYGKSGARESMQKSRYWPWLVQKKDPWEPALDEEGNPKIANAINQPSDKVKKNELIPSEKHNSFALAKPEI